MPDWIGDQMTGAGPEATRVFARNAQIAAIAKGKPIGKIDPKRASRSGPVAKVCAMSAPSPTWLAKASDPAARIRHEGRRCPKADPRWPGCGLLASSSTGRANVLVDPEQVSEAIA
jgi:hypothetical protein